MHNAITWILVANASEAKLYRLVRFPKIEEIDSLAHPESRLHDQDLISSKPGRNFERTGTTRHAYEAKAGPQQLEMHKFAKTLSSYLANAQEKKQFQRLYIIASPSFLGLLRQYLSNQTQETIINEFPKDIVKHNKEDVEKILSEA